MKKITLLFAAILLVAIGAKAQTINNPKDANGYYIVKWDCEKDTWATSNDFEVDEAFTFAVDITGTPFEDWLKQPATNAGATRGIAINRWCGFGNFRDDINRLKQIKGNIYGATWCFSQAANTFDMSLASVSGTITYFMMQVFGFEYTAENAGAGWYINAITIGGGDADGNVFTSAPYTGTKTSVEFYCDDYPGFWTYTVGGYAPSCTTIDYAEINTDIKNPKDANGYYIVKWDCAKNTWATSNDFEVDEAFTFAVDVTGTPLEEWLRQPVTNADGTRSIAVNRWSGFGDFNGDANRLEHIKGNIYGATWCFSQMANTFKVENATKSGVVTYFMMTVFGFEYTPKNAGALWWELPMDIEAVDGKAFTSAPYTGTKTSDAFASNDFEGFWTYKVGGYAPACAFKAEIDNGIKNPKDANGYYIVKWDCEKNTWAASNDFEVDEAFTFAIDITGTDFEEWVKTPTNADGVRSIAVNKWSGFGDFDGNSHRLRQIEGNIYGTTWCFAQMGGAFKVADATKAGAVTYFMMTVFGFEYTPKNPGALWWELPMDVKGVDGNAFTSAPYTGTKTSSKFSANDFEGFWTSVGGYAPTCAVIGKESGIRSVIVDSPVIRHEYYNMLGVKLSREPISGLFIDKAIKADGTSVATKVLKPLK